MFALIFTQKPRKHNFRFYHNEYKWWVCFNAHEKLSFLVVLLMLMLHFTWRMRKRWKDNRGNCVCLCFNTPFAWTIFLLNLVFYAEENVENNRCSCNKCMNIENSLLVRSIYTYNMNVYKISMRFIVPTRIPFNLNKSYSFVIYLDLLLCYANKDTS